MDNSDYIIDIDKNTTVSEIHNEVVKNVAVDLATGAYEMENKKIKVIDVEEFEFDDELDYLIPKEDENLMGEKGLK